MNPASTVDGANTRYAHHLRSESGLIGRLAVVGMATFFGLIFLGMGPNADIVGGVFCLAVAIMAMVPEQSTLTAPRQEAQR